MITEPLILLLKMDIEDNDDPETLKLLEEAYFQEYIQDNEGAYV